MNADMYIVIEVPHQREVIDSTFEDYGDAVDHFSRIAAHEKSEAFEAWTKQQRGEDFQVWGDGSSELYELVWEWVAHDLHALYRYTLAEAREKLAWLDAPNGGQQKIHQQLAVAAALRRFVENRAGTCESCGASLARYIAGVRACDACYCP
ncbi:MAG: hypothetical protein CL793_07415 [Chloroflexi bacterium]|nr:hypothetical protein [Chloroflexota bacterium]|tara:strand:- start:10456 stop:10908 length:453 start_codon:yes stop_codon:yes gene_type:complete